MNMHIPKVLLWLVVSFLVVLCVLLLQKNRILAEKLLLVPFFSFINPQKQLSLEKSLLELANNEKIRTLSNENEQLKAQLGFIPEKADLIPVRVLWSNGTHYILTLQQHAKSSYNVVGSPVVYKDILVGTIVRASNTIAVLQQVSDAAFEQKGITERGVKGTIRGGFGQEVLFDTLVDESVKKGDRVFAVDEEKGWRFLVGTIQTVDAEKNLPTQTARILYFASVVPHSLLFIAL